MCSLRCIANLITIGLLLIFGSSCSKEIHSFRIYEEDGVTIAETTGGPKYEGELFAYEEFLELQQDTTRQESLLYRPERFLMDENGYLYLNDVGNNRVAVFDQNGKYSHQIGREGRGPGEFQYPRILFIREGTIAVQEMWSLRRTSVFSTEGTLDYLLTAPATSVGVDAIYPGPGNTIIYVCNRYFRQSEQPYLRWHHVNVVSAEMDTIAVFDTPKTETGFSSGTLIMSTFYGGRPKTLYIPEQGILTTTGKDPVFELFGLDGKRRKIIRADIIREPVTDDERTAIIETFQERLRIARNEQIRSSVQRQLQIMNIPNNKDFWSDVMVDEYGYIWAGEPIIMYLQPEEGRLFRVFSPDGEYLGDTIWKHHDWGTPSRGHFLTIVRDEETGETIPTVYRIRPAVEGLEYPD